MKEVTVMEELVEVKDLDKKKLEQSLGDPQAYSN